MSDVLISARNQLTGVVKSVEHGSVMTKITVDTVGQLLTSIIVNESSDELDIKEGDSVTVIIKATSVMILKDEATRISGRNKIPVTVKAIDKGGVVSKVTLDFAGNQLAAIIVNDSVDDLDISVGEQVYAIIKATSVMVMKD